MGIAVYVADDFAGACLHENCVGAVDAGDVQLLD